MALLLYPHLLINGDKADCSNYRRISQKTNYIQNFMIFFSQGKLCKETKLFGIISVNSDITDQLLTGYSAFIRHLRQKWSTVGQYINILTEFGKPIKVVMLIKTYRKVIIGKHLSNSFPIQNDMKQEDTLSSLL
jgi:hypothetical protein